MASESIAPGLGIRIEHALPRVGKEVICADHAYRQGWATLGNVGPMPERCAANRSQQGEVRLCSKARGETVSGDVPRAEAGTTGDNVLHRYHNQQLTDDSYSLLRAL